MQILMTHHPRDATLKIDPDALSEAVLFYIEENKGTLEKSTEEQKTERRKRQATGQIFKTVTLYRRSVLLFFISD